MNSTRLSLIALGAVVPLATAKADLSNNLLAYYNFESADTAGLANQVGGGVTHNGRYGSGTTYDVIPAFGSGAGFAGNAAFPGAEETATTDRSTMLVGKALNIAKSDASTTAGSGWFNVPSLNASTLGGAFTISAWFYLAPDDDNTGTTADILRDYVFEGAENFDVSFGSTDANGSSFISWLGEGSSVGAGLLATGQWHHVAHVFTQTGANTVLAVYIDGVKTGNNLTTATSNLNFTALNFGAARNGTRVFDGMLDEVAVWGRALTANEVTELHQRGTASLALNADLAAAGKAFVSVEASDPVMGRALGTGLYDLNTQTTIDAEAILGHLFSGWAAPFNVNLQPSFNHTVTGSVTITANFSQNTADDDSDGLTNYQELVTYGTDPDDADTDDDLLKDGDEVLHTQTSPLISQADAVNYILQNLAGGGGPGATVLARNEANNTLTLHLKAGSSTTLTGAWNSLLPGPSVTGAASSGDFRLQLPGTADPKRFFRVEGNAP